MFYPCVSLGFFWFTQSPKQHRLVSIDQRPLESYRAGVKRRFILIYIFGPSLNKQHLFPRCKLNINLIDSNVRLNEDDKMY